MHKYALRKELRIYEKVSFPVVLFQHPFLIDCMNLFAKITVKLTKFDKHIQKTEMAIPGYKNENISVTLYEPSNVEKNCPCFIYFHGGGFAASDLGYMHKAVSQYAIVAKCKVFFVHYRLAHHYPFPVPAEDCYSSVCWIFDHAQNYGINKDKIAVGGDSAGGDLAAVVTHMARDRKGPSICYQMLLYPVTDVMQSTNSMRKFSDTPIWNSRLNKEMWKLYLKNGDYGELGYAAPLQNTDFTNLPNAYVEVEEFDCLHDEGIAYANKLEENNCQVELRDVKGTFHAFDMFNKSITKKMIRVRSQALKNAFK